MSIGQDHVLQKPDRSLNDWAGKGNNRIAFATNGNPPKLFFTETGVGINVLLLHGWSCDSHDWSWQMPALESKYKVVALDLRGHGRSEILPSGAYAPDDYAGDVERFITSNYPAQSFIVIGHSMGAQIAARLALARPDLIDGVISVDGSLGFSNELRPVFQQTVDRLLTENPAVAGRALFDAVYDPATPLATRRWHARRLEGTADQVVRETLPPLFFGAGQVGIGEESEAFCRSLTIPFYQLSRDPAQADRMRHWFSHPDSKVDYWSDAGHWIMQDRPDETNAAIIAWIESLQI